MRLGVISIVSAIFALPLYTVAPATADSMGPMIVVPGRPGVPVIINGVDATGAVVYGDWGLARPGHGQIVIEGPVVYAAPPIAGAYYPATGHAPRYGRDEVEPPPHPRAPTTFRRSWSAESDMTRPVTEYPPFNPPPVILAPQAQRAPSGHK